MEHQNVFEAHRGLHDFVSPDDEHAANGVNATLVLKAGNEVCYHLKLGSLTREQLVAGVYAVLDYSRT